MLYFCLFEQLIRPQAGEPQRYTAATPMISKQQMFPLLLEACPSFEPRWMQFLAEWKHETDPPLYLALSDFARHLVGLLETKESANFPKIFAVVERLLLEGDPFVKEASTVGLLENLQNLNLHNSTTPSQFVPYFCPETKLWWGKLYNFWDKGILLTDDE